MTTPFLISDLPPQRTEFCADGTKKCNKKSRYTSAIKITQNNFKGMFIIIKIALRISDSMTDIVRNTKGGLRLAVLSADTPFITALRFAKALDDVTLSICASIIIALNS